MQEIRNRYVIIGATSAIAEHCARLWVQSHPIDISLVGRDLSRIERVAADLRVRSPHSLVQAHTVNFTDPAAIGRLAADIAAAGPVDTVLIAHGDLPVQIHCQNDLRACQEALVINGLSTVLFAEAFAGQMQKSNSGTLVVIGSVAGDRGRRSNYVYGAAKGMVSRYIQGLQHRMVGTGVKVVLVKPGPTDTPMTRTLRQAGKRLASVEEVAGLIVSGAKKGRRVVYAPTKWALVMMVIRHLPNFIFDRLDI